VKEPTGRDERVTLPDDAENVLRALLAIGNGDSGDDGEQHGEHDRHRGTEPNGGT
jgi:hypothetical protein